ncbi:MAG: FAD:protein FMN transferase [Marinilabiliaceae bacterium]|nr:FAD:protein FMN transferase [Marinilabiliaceae bacterium]
MKNILLILILSLLVSCQPSKREFIRNEGFIFGTTYHLIYDHSEDLHEDIKIKFNEFDLSLSTYNKQSIISKVNRNEPVEVDHFFKTVFQKAAEVTQATEGAFDMTIGPLANAWGFGFSNKDSITSELVDSLLINMGMDKLKLEGNRVVKTNPDIVLNVNALAKGYGVDVIARLLEQHGITNYMVEIGGELRVKGYNQKHSHWRVGIDKPVDDPEVMSRDLQEVISITNTALATSGNYRNFYFKEGKKYAHTISPYTGYPVQHQLLSASVIAPDCMTADAYATAFMVLGLEKSLEIMKQHPELEAYFISSDEQETYRITMTDNFHKFIDEK